ncbi:hypothetical protein PMIN03_010986 [Paraphaeosphaeria minitans]
MPLHVVDLLSPDELRQLHKHLQGIFSLYHMDQGRHWGQVLNEILLRLQSLGCELPEVLPLQLMKFLNIGAYPTKQEISAICWINAGMQGPPPPEAHMDHIVQNPTMDLFFLPDGRSIVLRDKGQTVCEAMEAQNSTGYWTKWIDCITKNIPLLVDENRGNRCIKSSLRLSLAWYVWEHDGASYGGGRFVLLDENTDSDSNSNESRLENLPCAPETAAMRNNAYLNDQREEVAGPSAKPSTMYEQLEKPIGPKKGGSSHAAAKKPKETFHCSDVNATHFPSRVGQLQKGLQQDIHPARQNDGGQCIPTTKGNRAAVFFVDE